jgi:hypothetical protein
MVFAVVGNDWARKIFFNSDLFEEAMQWSRRSIVRFFWDSCTDNRG